MIMRAIIEVCHLL